MATSTVAEAQTGVFPASDCRPPQSDNIVSICWRQWRTERALRARGIDFRTTDPDAARRAYAAMTPEEFAAINGRQAWANWRTISRSLDRICPTEPVLALDLGSGNGEATACLAALLPVGSRIVGIELAEPLVEVARSRVYLDFEGKECLPVFHVGSITSSFLDEHGNPLEDRSVDLVNASGIVGHHLDRPDAETVAEEIARVMRPGGLALLDVGPKLSGADLTELMADLGFRKLRRTRSNPFDRTGQVVFRYEPKAQRRPRR